MQEVLSEHFDELKREREFPKRDSYPEKDAGFMFYKSTRL